MDFEIRIGDPDDDGMEATGEGSPKAIVELLRAMADIMEKNHVDIVKGA